MFYTIIFTLLLSAVAVWLYNKWKENREKEFEKGIEDELRNAPERGTKSDNNNSSMRKNTKEHSVELMRKALAEMGCQMTEHEDDEEGVVRYSTVFQGETFMMAFYDEMAAGTLYDLWWYSVDAADIDELVMVRRAVNECNLNFLDATLCYTMSEDQQMGVHTKVGLLMLDEIPNFNQYIRSRFMMAFHQKNGFLREMDRLRALAHE